VFPFWRHPIFFFEFPQNEDFGAFPDIPSAIRLGSRAARFLLKWSSQARSGDDRERPSLNFRKNGVMTGSFCLTANCSCVTILFISIIDLNCDDKTNIKRGET